VETKAPARPNPGLARVTHQAFRIMESNTGLTMVRCSAGVSPAIFLRLHTARMPAGRRRYEKRVFLLESNELQRWFSITHCARQGSL
jgi:hypothetical protein